MAKIGFAAIGLVYGGLTAAMLHQAAAAVPASSAALAVSATVLPRCNSTGCGDIPRVVSYAPASRLAPSPGLAWGDATVMTITY